MWHSDVISVWIRMIQMKESIQTPGSPNKEEQTAGQHGKPPGGLTWTSELFTLRRCIG